MQKKGIWALTIAVILVLVVITIFFNNGPSPSDVLNSQNNSEQEQIFCTADVKICDDGTAVARTPPTCEFKACPVDSSIPPLPPIPGTEEVKISIANFAFAPATITIKSGTKVTWTNQDSVQHTATSILSPPESFDSGLLARGESFSFTFTKPGTYDYHCTPHPSMKGKIIVE